MIFLLFRIISNKKHLLHEELDGTQIFNVVCLCILDKLAFCWSLIEETALQNQVYSFMYTVNDLFSPGGGGEFNFWGPRGAYKRGGFYKNSQIKSFLWCLLG